MEIWKTIKGFENYEVSNYGNVRSLERTITSKKWGYQKIKGRVLKKNISGRYETVILSSNNKIKSFLVHRLVCIAFVDNKQEKPEVNHIDGNKMNNNYLNLEWCTSKENKIHSVKNNLHKSGELVYNSKLTNIQAFEIRNLKGIISQRKLSIKYNVSQKTIWEIQNNKSYLKND